MYELEEQDEKFENATKRGIKVCKIWICIDIVFVFVHIILFFLHENIVFKTSSFIFIFVFAYMVLIFVRSKKRYEQVLEKLKEIREYERNSLFGG